MFDLFLQRFDSILKSHPLKLIDSFNVFNFVLFLLNDFFEISNLGIVKVFWVVLATSNVLELVDKTGLKLVLQFFNFLLFFNFQCIFLFMQNWDLSKKFFKLRLMRSLLHLNLQCQVLSLIFCFSHNIFRLFLEKEKFIIGSFDFMSQFVC